MGTQTTWEDWATRLVSAASVAALGYFILFVDFSGHGRVWDQLSARFPALAKIIPPAAGSQGTVVVKGGAGMDKVDMQDRTLISREQAAAAPAAPATTPAPAAVAAAPVQRQAPTPRLTTSLSGFDVRSAPSRTSASLDAAPAAAQALAAEPSAGTAAAAPAAAGSAAVIAAKSSYGAASRSEVMGQAAGPVYNFKGKKK